MLLLDLFCGAGGCTKGYERAGFTVIGVDLNPQPNYCGSEFWQYDALSVLEQGVIGSYWVKDFDVIHASPPCQAHSTLSSSWNAGMYESLVADTRSLLETYGKPWVIENVVGAPLNDPIMLCGSSFGLPLRRHRLFESNIPMMSLSCAHHLGDPVFDKYEHGEWSKTSWVPVYGKGGGKAREHWANAMGIDWMTHDEMAQAIPPAYTQYIGEVILEAKRGDHFAPAAVSGEDKER